MTMLADVVDAVIGIDTHRDTHEVEIADAAGRPIAVMQIGNDSSQTAARIGSGGPGDSLRIWPRGRAFLLTCPRVAGPAWPTALT